MNSQKKHPSDKLQKSSILFLQLGLVLTLFLVYGALEFETVKKKFPLAENTSTYPDIPMETVHEFTILRKVEKVIEQKPKAKSIEKFKKIKNDEPEIINILKPTETIDEGDINKRINSLPGGDTEPVEPPIEDIDFKILEDAPIFPGCEGLEKEASKKCFTEGISKFVSRKFNASIAESLNLKSGKQKIWVEFKVDKTGEIVDIRARAPHKRLEKEAIRVIEKLPQMTPGKQRKRPVGVKYTLPIAFQVY